MKYTKPSLSALGSSIRTMRGGSTKITVPLLEQSGAFFALTQPAYEADE